MFLHGQTTSLPHPFAVLHEAVAFLHGFHQKNRSLSVSDTRQESTAPYPRLFATRTASISGLELRGNSWHAGRNEESAGKGVKDSASHFNDCVRNSKRSCKNSKREGSNTHLGVSKHPTRHQLGSLSRFNMRKLLQIQSDPLRSSNMPAFRMRKA